MYVVLSIFFLLFVGTIVAVGKMLSFAQSGPSQDSGSFDRMKRRMELREEMHKRMRDKLLHGIGPDQDMFKDLEKMMEETMADSFSQFDQLTSVSSQFQSEWTESKTGRTLVITPKDPNQKMNIDVNASMVTIKGESTQNQNGSSYSSSFSNSFSVPDDCDGSRVKMDQKEGKLLIQFPFKSAKAVALPPKQDNQRKPIPKSEGDVEI